MTREFGKSILLFVLVAVSLTLTWSIWSYQGDYAPVNPSKPTKIADIASSYAPYEVIKPYQIIRYESDESGHVLGKFGDGGDPLYKLVINSTLTLHSQLPAEFPKRVGPTYELDFPTPLTANVIKSLFKFNDPNNSSINTDWLIDRVEVFQTDSKSESAYVVFKDQLGHPKFYAKGDIDGLASYNSDVEKSDDWLKYTKKKLSDKMIYIPDQAIDSLSVESHLFSLVDFEKYRSIVFNNPRQVSYVGNSYTDFVSQLSNQQKLVMKFVNPVLNSSPSSTTSSGTFGDPILQTYNFINSHKGWTNSFNIDNLTTYPATGESKVIFRMTQHGLPVFSTAAYPYDLESEILMQWNGGDYSEFYRTLIQLGMSFRNPKVKIPSPKEELELMAKTGNFKLQDISDFKLGYEMTVNQTQNEQTVTLTPSWFFEENGTWMSVSDYLNSHNAVMKNSQGGGT